MGSSSAPFDTSSSAGTSSPSLDSSSSVERFHSHNLVEEKLSVPRVFLIYDWTRYERDLDVSSGVTLSRLPMEKSRLHRFR